MLLCTAKFRNISPFSNHLSACKFLNTAENFRFDHSRECKGLKDFPIQFNFSRRVTDTVPRKLRLEFEVGIKQHNCFIFAAISRWYFDFPIDKNGDQESIGLFTS